MSVIIVNKISEKCLKLSLIPLSQTFQTLRISLIPRSTDKMKQFLYTALASATGQIVAFLLYQGFVQSYWGKNIREEISRWFDKLCKHVQKQKGNK